MQDYIEMANVSALKDDLKLYRSVCFVNDKSKREA